MYHNQWRSQGGTWVHIPRLSWKSAFVSGFWGFCPRPPPGLFPWTQLGNGPPGPFFCPPPRSKFLAMPLTTIIIYIDRVSSMEELWTETWEADPLVNFYIIDDPTALLPGFDLPRREWCLNRFRSDTGRCAASLCQWGSTDNPLCFCGDTQSLSHMVNDRPVNKFEGGLPALHAASDSATESLRRAHCIR